MKAKKSFGQHFLNNEHIAEKIANSLPTSAQKIKVLEIGPGKGVLTKYLAKLYKDDFKAIEADKDMVAYLKHHQIITEDQIIFLDFLKINLHRVFDENQLYLIGNYPYNISSQIIIKMINSKELVPAMVGMFQKEVADRIVSPPGSKTYGVLSVLVQAHYEGRTILDVAPSSFTPPPKVQSSVILLERKANYILDCDEKFFRTIVKAAFNQRRKMLRNTIKQFTDDENLLSMPIFTMRPEQLSVADFVNITNLLSIK